jgi:AraC family transcriptional regulator, arabinose operon regulatory protein
MRVATQRPEVAADIVLAGTNRWPPRPWSRPTAHSAWDMTYTTAGSGRYRIGAMQLTTATGDVILFHRDTPLEHAAPGPVTWDYHYACFEPSTGWSPPDPFAQVAPGVYRARAALTQTRQRIEDAFRRLIGDIRARDAVETLAGLHRGRRDPEERGAAEARRELALAALDEVFLLLKGDALETVRLDPRIVATLQIITNDLAAHHETNALARTAGLSESRFLHLFREQLGVPLRHAIRTLRLQQAAVLLAYGDEPVGTIAEDVGFSSIFALSREFRRTYGVSPRAYRERFRTVSVPRG